MFAENMNKMIAGDQMITLKHICVFCFILFMTLVNCTCKTYPPTVEEACYCLCIEDNWVSKNDDMSTAETERMCKEGRTNFQCGVKDAYDEAVDKTPFLEPMECPSYHF